ncbi:hypothetical protein CA54_47120 [Symmachiella macrocystis]|uniref:Sulfatase n=1 Tax=Symmachiella macrocystis TaxID=2527985 RepID=A0A5C6BC14_9PLAN|nr:DUF1501 domain-containing protein [Symmachiella macrocystis]TWU09470.1 hypothetical protein CA54_47120 [Symmachiella macrocystis]
MLNLFPSVGSPPRISRRDLLRMGPLALAGLSLPNLLQAEETPSAHPRQAATAKNCIYIFLCGGPSQIDLWDPKPDAPLEIRGEYQPIDSNVPGIQIGDLLPLTSQRADKFAILRSQYAYSAAHGVAIMDSLLGQKNPRPNETFPTRSDHPGFGAILHNLLGGCGDLPAWVTVPRPFTTGSVFFKGQTGGFLGPAFDPFMLNKPKKDSLSHELFQVDAIQPIVPAGRIAGRQKLLEQIEGTKALQQHSTEGADLDKHYRNAFSLLSDNGAKQAFDLSLESAATRARYGHNEYGQSFLMARRLVEAGVRMVNLFWTFFGPDGCQFNLWDNHGIDGPVCGGPNRGNAMLRHEYCTPSFDRSFTALLDDLDDRGLLDETLVVVTGEFGRTPKINKLAGRDHWAGCQSTVLAGGGVRGGQVYGSTDAHAGYVQDHPVSPDDLGATIHHAFGLSPDEAVYSQAGRPTRISEGHPVVELFG